MKRKKYIFTGLIFIMILLPACVGKEETAKELIDYNNSTYITIQQKKSELTDLNDQLSEVQSESFDKAANFVEEEFLPVVIEVVDELEETDLNHRDIIKLNDLQIDAEKYGIELTNKLIEYYQGNLDEIELQDAMEKQKEKYDDFLNEREKLMEKYNVVFEEDSDTGYGMRVKLKEDD